MMVPRVWAHPLPEVFFKPSSCKGDSTASGSTTCSATHPTPLHTKHGVGPMP